MGVSQVYLQCRKYKKNLGQSSWGRQREASAKKCEDPGSCLCDQGRRTTQIDFEEIDVGSPRLFPIHIDVHFYDIAQSRSHTGTSTTPAVPSAESAPESRGSRSVCGTRYAGLSAPGRFEFIVKMNRKAAS